MFSAIKYQLEVRRLNRELDRVERRYLAEREAAAKDANANLPPAYGEYGPSKSPDTRQR
jgi:hypothetical protein